MVVQNVFFCRRSWLPAGSLKCLRFTQQAELRMKAWHWTRVGWFVAKWRDGYAVLKISFPLNVTCFSFCFPFPKKTLKWSDEIWWNAMLLSLNLSWPGSDCLGPCAHGLGYRGAADSGARADREDVNFQDPLVVVWKTGGDWVVNERKVSIIQCLMSLTISLFIHTLHYIFTYI